MHGVTFLQDLAVVMILAGLVTVIFHRFKQPVVLGYIIAGVIIGPHTPPSPLVEDEETIKTRGAGRLVLGRAAVQVYSMAQDALQETLAQGQPPRPDVASAPMPSMLREALLETVTVDPDSLAGGKLIRELQLRTRIGASIVGIERDGASIINPGPDEELQPGDQVLLLGSRSQLDAAHAVLSKATR
jgi:uncharacterized transporter YbjL